MLVNNTGGTTVWREHIFKMFIVTPVIQIQSCEKLFCHFVMFIKTNREICERMERWMDGCKEIGGVFLFVFLKKSIH